MGLFLSEKKRPSIDIIEEPSVDNRSQDIKELFNVIRIKNNIKVGVNSSK